MAAQDSSAPASAAQQRNGCGRSRPAQPPAQQGAAQEACASRGPAGGSGPPANQPGDTVQVPAPQGQAADAQHDDVFVFKKEVDEVTLHATVVDDRNRLITNLTKGDFNVFEDGKAQKITSFRNEDIPVALGIVIDNSGSMRDKRPQVNAAAHQSGEVQ